MESIQPIIILCDVRLLAPFKLLLVYATIVQIEHCLSGIVYALLPIASFANAQSLWPKNSLVTRNEKARALRAKTDRSAHTTNKTKAVSLRNTIYGASCGTCRASRVGDSYEKYVYC